MRHYIFALAAALTLSACATGPSPAEMCSAAWIKPRAQSAVKDIEKDTRSVFKALNKSAGSYAKGKTPGPIELFRLSRAVDQLTRELKSGQGIKDLRRLRDTCNDPDLISDTLTGFMQDKGLPPGLMQFIQGLGIYQELISEPVSRT